jgi:formylglycine-generating enzyme required for sulfatase activity
LPAISAKSVENACSFVAQKDSAFYISNFEVSNALYNAFLSSLEGENLKKALPKDSLWSQETSLLQYAQYHTQFPTHPVCNIDKASMLDFCQWLENKKTQNYQSNLQLAMARAEREKSFFTRIKEKLLSNKNKRLYFGS